MAQWLEGVIGRLRAIEADAEPVSLLPDRVMSVRETFDLLLPLLAPPDPSGTPGPSATAASSPTPGTEPDEAALQQQWFGDDESAQTVFELDQCLRRCLTARPLAAHIFPAPPAAGVYPPRSTYRAQITTCRRSSGLSSWSSFAAASCFGRQPRRSQSTPATRFHSCWRTSDLWKRLTASCSPSPGHLKITCLPKKVAGAN